MNLKELRSSISAFHDARQTIMILGAPGMGKTEQIDQAAADQSVRLGRPFALVTAILSGNDPVDMRGFLFPTKGKFWVSGSEPVEVMLGRNSVPNIWPSNSSVEVFVDGKKLSKEESLKHCNEHGIPADGWLFFDEFSQVDSDIQKVSAQVMLDRRMGEHVLPDGWMVIAAGNRTEDRAGVTKMLSHLQNRMCSINIDPDYQAWQDWAFTAGLHPLAIGFAKSNAGDVFRTHVPKEPGPFCTPRSLVMCTKNLVAMRTAGMGELQLPDNHIAAEVIKGWLGESILPKFISHIRLANDLPDVEDVIKDPDGTPVPERIDARFVMSTSLAVHASDTTKAKPILKYIERYDIELQTLFVQAVVGRNARALTMKEFSQWVTRNQKLMLAAHG